MGALRDREVRSYAGILFVREDALRDLAHLDRSSVIDGAELQGQSVLLSWRGGNRSQVPWADLRKRAGLDDLPPPRAAFAGAGEIGLLIASETPRPGLAFREPHSTVQSIGLLTSEGLRRG